MTKSKSAPPWQTRSLPNWASDPDQRPDKMPPRRPLVQAVFESFAELHGDVDGYVEPYEEILYLGLFDPPIQGKAKTTARLKLIEKKAFELHSLLRDLGQPAISEVVAHEQPYHPAIRELNNSEPNLGSALDGLVWLEGAARAVGSMGLGKSKSGSAADPRVYAAIELAERHFREITGRNPTNPSDGGDSSGENQSEFQNFLDRLFCSLGWEADIIGPARRVLAGHRKATPEHGE
jgi:hypothetical protein